MSVLFLGASGVGKTAIIESLSQQLPVSRPKDPTIEASVSFQYIMNAATWPALNMFFREFLSHLSPSLESLGHTRALELVELGGDLGLESLLTSHVVAADSIAFVFDLFDFSSFESLWELYQQVARIKGDSIRQTPMIIFGHHLPKTEQRDSQIPDQAIQGMSKLLHIPCLKVSQEDSHSYRFGIDILILWLQSLPAIATAQYHLREGPRLLTSKKTSSFIPQRDKMFAAFNSKESDQSKTA